MKRIMIYGGAGSGKSSLAHTLGKIAGLPVIYIDKIYWKPGWVFRERAEIGRMTIEAADEEHWVFEGNHTETMSYRASRADMLIFLDISTPIRLWRVIKRSVKNYGKIRPDMAEGCPERLDWKFLKWVVGYNKNGRIRALDFYRDAPEHVRKYHLRSPQEVEAFLTSFRHEINQKQASIPNTEK